MIAKTATIMAATLLLGASTLAAAQTAPTRILSTETLTSVSEVADMDAISLNVELFTAIQSLIERYGVGGIVFTDKMLHPGRDIRAGEAKLFLQSVFAQATMLGDAVSGDNAGDAAKAAKMKVSIKALLVPSATCRILADTPYMAGTPKKPKPFPAATLLTRKDVLDCLPGTRAKPIAGSAVKATIARAEMIVTAHDALDRVQLAMQELY
jgi:hypothetical protein